MIDALFNQPNYLAAKKLLDGTVLRHEAIASNLANLETPNYKRIDLAPSFAAELNTAMASQNPAQISNIHPQLAVDGTAMARGRDGNTVQLEEELMRLNQNTLENAVEAQMVSASLAKMRLAVTGKS